MKNKDLIIKRANLFTLVQWLRQIPLTVEMTRERTRFIKSCSYVVEEMEARRIEMIKKYCNKDDKGEPIMLDNDGVMEFDFEDDKKELFKKEYEEFAKEEVNITQDNNKSKFQSIRDILANTSFEFKGILADEYNSWCEAFDSIDFS